MGDTAPKLSGLKGGPKSNFVIKNSLDTSHALGRKHKFGSMDMKNNVQASGSDALFIL